jgi:hypothetical protein
VNFGVWNSLQTGSSGSDGFSERLHYEEDFHTTLSLGFSKNITLGTTYTAYTSPNLMFNTVHEISFKVAQSGRINPYGVLAFEVGEHGADGGEKGHLPRTGRPPSDQEGDSRHSVTRAGLSNSTNSMEKTQVRLLVIGGLIRCRSRRQQLDREHPRRRELLRSAIRRSHQPDDSSKMVGQIGIA